ncbi:MAG: class I SAM-dependent methyltransferase [Actinomycetota bacterium]
MAAGRWSGYERMAAHVAPAAERVAQLLGWGQKRTVLDIGTGSGAVLAPAARLGWSPTGLDLAADQLGDAREAHPAVSFVRGDAQRLPFADESFDAAASNFGIIFAPDLPAALRESARVLRRNGHLVLSAWSPGGWPDPCRRILGAAPESSFPTELGDPARLERPIIDAGFRVESWLAARLEWRFRDVEDAVDTLTTAAGGLRVLREKVEPTDRWPEVRDALRAEIAGRMTPTDGGDHRIWDDYLVVTASRC